MTGSLLLCQIQEAVNMAPQLFDCTVPLKVFSFRANTDYRRIPRVSEAPFQQSDSFPQSALFQSNNNAEHSPTAIIPKNSRAVLCLTFDFYALTFQIHPHGSNP